MRIFLCLFLLLFAGIGVVVNYAQPACPECYSNQSHLTGHGNIWSRVLLNIYIDSSWNVDPQGNSTPFQTNINVWNHELRQLGLYALSLDYKESNRTDQIGRASCRERE